MADVFAPQPVKTKANGDVVVSIVDAAGSNKAAVSAAGAVSTNIVNTIIATTDSANGTVTPGAVATKSELAGVQFNTTPPTLTTGQQVAMQSDVSGNLKVNVANTPAVTVTSGTLIATQATGTNLHAVLDSGSTTVATQATGTNLHTVVDSGTVVVTQPTGTNLHVVIDGAVATTGGGLVGTVADNYLTSAALAAGATVTLDSTSVPSGTGHLTEATVSSSVALKAQLGTWNGTTLTVKRTFFIPANSAFSYLPSRSDELNLPTSATATYRWSITNNDNTNAADVYASTTYYYA
jgi:hypothetical protein